MNASSDAIAFENGKRIASGPLADVALTVRRHAGHAAHEGVQIFDAVSEIIDTHAPAEVAIERVFMARNPDSALKLGQARGAAICAAVCRGLALSEYAPKEIKQAVVGGGGADKSQVQHMVGIMLGLQGKLQADAADALAVAITQAHGRATAKRLGVATRTAWRKSR